LPCTEQVSRDSGHGNLDTCDRFELGSELGMRTPSIRLRA